MVKPPKKGIDTTQIVGVDVTADGPVWGELTECDPRCEMREQEAKSTEEENLIPVDKEWVTKMALAWSVSGCTIFDVVEDAIRAYRILVAATNSLSSQKPDLDVTSTNAETRAKAVMGSGLGGGRLGKVLVEASGPCTDEALRVLNGAMSAFAHLCNHMPSTDSSRASQHCRNPDLIRSAEA